MLHDLCKYLLEAFRLDFVASISTDVFVALEDPVITNLAKNSCQTEHRGPVVPAENILIDIKGILVLGSRTLPCELISTYTEHASRYYWRREPSGRNH